MTGHDVRRQPVSYNGDVKEIPTRVTSRKTLLLPSRLPACRVCLASYGSVVAEMQWKAKTGY